MQASVFIKGRGALGISVVPSEMQWMALDVGIRRKCAEIRLPIPKSEGQQPEVEWCQQQLRKLIPKLKSRSAIAPAEIDLEDGVSAESVVKELERAISTPGGISASFRGRWQI